MVSRGLTWRTIWRTQEISVRRCKTLCPIRGHSVLKAVMASAGEAQLADVVLDERIKALADVCAHRARGSRSSRPSAAIPRITFTLTLFRSR